MTRDEAEKLIAAGDQFMRAYRVDGRDLYVENSAAWTWGDLQKLAQILGTQAIDFMDYKRYHTLPPHEPIVDLYEYEGGGCDSCGFGSVVVVRGIIDAANRVAR